MFAGRRGNLGINLPMFYRIVEDNPRVQFHIWDLARDPADADYLKVIAGKVHDRVEVQRQYSGPRAPRCMNKVWQHYTAPRYREALFVKVDDDIVFVQTEHFAAFVDAIEANPDTVLSAEVVNNGACTEFVPGIWDGFIGLDIPLLDVHESNEYALMSHQYLIENWRALCARPTALASIETWLSINFIGMDWEMLCRIQGKIGRVSPEWIADRRWRAGSRMGDEGAANLYPRAVMRGFTVGHLGFGPQKLTEDQENIIRDRYATIADEYLADLGVQKLNTLAGRQ
jgi:hypothetical protein